MENCSNYALDGLCLFDSVSQSVMLTAASVLGFEGFFQPRHGGYVCYYLKMFTRTMLPFFSPSANARNHYQNTLCDAVRVVPIIPYIYKYTY
jgi:hypothetical protein